MSTPSFLFFIPKIESLQPVVNYPFKHVVCLDKLTEDHPKAFVTSAESASNFVTKGTTKSEGFKEIMDHLDALTPTMSLVTILRHQWSILVICKNMIFG